MAQILSVGGYGPIATIAISFGIRLASGVRSHSARIISVGDGRGESKHMAWNRYYVYSSIDRKHSSVSLTKYVTYYYYVR